MHAPHRPAGPVLPCLLAFALAVASGAAGAEQHGKTLLGGDFVSGGASGDERTGLEARVKDFDLWVVTAVRRTGAYIADAEVRIEDARRRTVFDGTLDGPWLLVNLPPGRYEIECRVGEQRQRTATTLRAGEHRHVVLYFDVEGEVLRPASAPAASAPN